MEHDQHATSPELVCREFGLRSLDEKARTVECVASTAAVDSYGDIVEQRWRLERYLANPVVLYAHNRYSELPIGTAENVRMEGGALVATLKIATAEANPRAEQVWQSIRQGTLRAVSVGFVPNDIRFELRDGVEVCVLSDNELHEISVVPIPANPEAVMRMRARARGAVPPSEAASAAVSSHNAEEKHMKFLELAAKMNIAAANEEAAQAAIVALAEEGAQVRATLGTKSAGETAARVAELSTKAAELPKVEAERNALRAEKEASEARERAAHLAAVIEARPELEAAKAALEAFAKADFAGFAKTYPRPASTARERALTSQVIPPAAGTPAPVAERMAPATGTEAMLEAADQMARELMAKDKSLDYRAALKQAGEALGAARRAARGA